MMKVFDLPSESLNELTETQLIDMSGENFTIATNNIDKIAFGGSDKMVYVVAVALDNVTNQLKLEGDQTIGMVFNSSITKVEFIGAKYLLALSEDSSA